MFENIVKSDDVVPVSRVQCSWKLTQNHAMAVCPCFGGYRVVRFDTHCIVAAGSRCFEKPAVGTADIEQFAVRRCHGVHLGEYDLEVALAESFQSLGAGRLVYPFDLIDPDWKVAREEPASRADECVGQEMGSHRAAAHAARDALSHRFGCVA